MRPAWRPTVVFGSTVLLTVVMLVLAVVLRRPDLVVVAAPFLVCLALALARGPATTSPQLEVWVPGEPVWEGDSPVVRIAVTDADGVDAVQFGIPHAAGLEALDTAPLCCLRPGETADFRFSAARWGHQSVGPIASVLIAGHGLLAARGGSHPGTSIPVLPSREMFSTTDAAPTAVGLVGGHRSHRPGEGTDLAQIRPFLPGDRLRRISWPVSARTGRLHVTATFEDLDVEVYLLIDSGVDIGRASRAEATSLDITVRAAAAIAEHYLRIGDRVGLLDLGSRRRPVPARGGRRHLRRLLAALLDAAPDLLADADASRRDPRLRDISTRALVIVLSALLDEQIERRLATLARRGNPTLVIDTLPPDGQARDRQDRTALAWRLAMLRRDTLRSRLADHGIPVVRWQGAGSLDHVLTQLARSVTMSRRRQ